MWLIPRVGAALVVAPDWAGKKPALPFIATLRNPDEPQKQRLAGATNK